MKTIHAKYVTDTPEKKFRLNKVNTAWHWFNVWRRMSPEDDNRWENLQIVDPDYPIHDTDLYIIVNHPVFYAPFDYYVPERAIILQLEPTVVRVGWGDWMNPDHKKFLFVHSIRKRHMTIDWNVDIPFAELKNLQPEKTKLMSSVLSWKRKYVGHELRLNFLQKQLHEFEGLDNYGYLRHKQDFTYSNYCGELPPRDKAEALLHYKYHFCAENSMEFNYFTEKIIDPILCDCLPLYWGCPNINDFLPPDCYIWLPLENPDEALNIVKRAIINNEWEKRLPAIREAKKKIMNELQMFPVVHKLANELL